MVDVLKKRYPWYEGSSNVEYNPFEAFGRGNTHRLLPLAAVGDALGMIGSERDNFVQGVWKPAIGANLALQRKVLPQTNRPGASWMFPTIPEGDPAFTREDLARYTEESYQGSPVGEFMTNFSGDFTNLFGGMMANLPLRLSRLATQGGKAAPLLAAASKMASPLAAVDSAYMALGQGATNFVKEAAPAAKRLPLIGKMFDESVAGKAQKQIDRVLDALSRSHNRGIDLQAEWGQAARRDRIHLSDATPESISRRTAGELGELETWLRTAHPAKARAMMGAVRDYHYERNMSQRQVGRQHFQAELDRASGLVADEDITPLKDALWKTHHSKDFQGIRSLRELADELDQTPDDYWESMIRSGTPEYEAHRKIIDQATDSTFGFSRTARSFDRQLQVAEDMGKIFPDPQLHVAVQAMDNLFTTENMIARKTWDTPSVGLPPARDGVNSIVGQLATAFKLDRKQVKLLTRTVTQHWRNQVDGNAAVDYLPKIYGDAGGRLSRQRRLLLEDAKYAEMRDMSNRALQTADEDLATNRPAGASVAGLGDDMTARFRERWLPRQFREGTGPGGVQGIGSEAWLAPEDSASLYQWDHAINRVNNTILSDRTKVLNRARSMLENAWNLKNVPSADRATMWAEASASRPMLIRALDEAGVLEGPRTPLLAILDKPAYRASDLLSDQRLPQLFQHQLSTEIGREMGVKATPPWFAPLHFMVSLWKNIQLISARYPLGNLASILIFGEKNGVHSDEVFSLLKQGFGEYAGKVRTINPNTGKVTWNLDPQDPIELRFHGALVPIARVFGMVDDEGYVTHAPSFLRTLAPNWTHSDIPIPGAPATTLAAVGSKRMGLALGALGGAVGAATADPEDRARQATAGAVGGLATGMALPPIANNIRIITMIIERAARGAAHHEGMRRAALPHAEALVNELRAGLQPGVRGGLSGIGHSSMPLNPPSRLVGRGPLVFDTGPGQRDLIDEVLTRKLQSLADGRYDDADLSPETIFRLYTAHGVRAEEAAEAARMAETAAKRVMDAGTDLSNKVNFDYGVPTNMEQWLKKSGIMPFVTWQRHAYPIFAHMILTDPRWMATISALMDMSEQEADDAGLTGRFRMMVKTGELGQWMHEMVTGRKGDVLVNPLSVFLPFGDVFQPPANRDNRAPLDAPLNALSDIGLGVSPFYTTPLEAAGAISPRGGSFARTTPYTEAASFAADSLLANPEAILRAGQGQPFTQSGRLAGSTNIEAPLRAVTQGARRAIGAPVERSITGDPARDYAIRERIAEMQVERPDLNPLDFERAKHDPSSPIWRIAQSDIERSQAGRTMMSSAIPARTTLASTTEQEVRQAMADQGVSTTQLAGLPPSEVETRRILAERADPRTAAFSALGSNPNVLAQREAALVKALVGQLPPTMRQGAWERYLASRGY